MSRYLQIVSATLGFVLLWPIVVKANLWAFSVVERANFREGSFSFKMELQVSGSGRLKKGPVRISAIKVKIKNERASPGVLQVKTIRAYQESSVYKDIETIGFSVAPGQWVTKFYQMRRENRPFLNDQGYLEVAFQKFTIQFDLRQRKFSGPFK